MKSHLTSVAVRARASLSLLAVLLATACTSLPPGASLPRPVSSAVTPSPADGLAKPFLGPAASHAGESGFKMLAAGLEGLRARLEMIDAAERSIDLQTYIFRADEAGTLIARALLRAAARGVRVRVLMDDGETVAGDERILSLAAHPGIEVRLFNPLRYRGHNPILRGAEFLLGKQRLDYRMHNKLMVADNATAIIGGRNIGDQYFQIDPESQFGDDDVVVAGPMVQRLSAVFDQFWNGDLAIPAQAIDRQDVARGGFPPEPASTTSTAAATAPSAVDAPPEASQHPFRSILSGHDPLVWAPVTLAYDSPDKRAVYEGNSPGRLIYKAVLERARAVGTELLMVTPYFIPSGDELAVLKDLRGRGARVSVLTNSLPAAPNLEAHSGYTHYRVELLREGVELHEIRALLGSGRGSGQSKAISRYGNYALHAKQFVFDRKTLFIGSMNYDQRSKHLNTEIGLLISSPELSSAAALRFEALTQLDNAYTVKLTGESSGKPGLTWETRESGHVVEYATEPARSGWQRLKVRLLGLVPLDEEL